MDFGRDEANMIQEDRAVEPCSGSHVAESEDEDNQQELEEMLYSRVFYDDSSIRGTEDCARASSMPEPTFTVKAVHVELKSSVAKSHINVPSLSSLPLQLPARCSPSQFNNPGRKKASRYYDVSQSESNCFSAPRKPYPNSFVQPLGAEKPTQLTSKLMARSKNESSYSPSSAMPKVHLSKDIQRVQSSETVLHSKSEKSSLKASTLTNNQVDGIKEAIVVANLPSGLEAETDMSSISVGSTESRKRTSSGREDVLPCTVLNAEDSHKKTINNKSNENGKLSSLSNNTKTSKQSSFEAKVSKVLSSMLDEESRSSADENHFVSTCANQNLREMSSNAGWSVGMSWADMSCNRFEADIEEESVSSLQLQESCLATDSRTATPDVGQWEEERETEEEPSEPSRYDLELKKQVDSNKNKRGRKELEADSESDVDSVVEVAPPVKPAPPLVDISDSEDVSVNQTERQSFDQRASSTVKDITVVFTRSKNAAGGPQQTFVEHVIESSSDDDLVILDHINSSESKDLPVQKSPHKRPSLATENGESLSPSEAVPRKRQSNCGNNIGMPESESERIERRKSLLQKSKPSMSTQNRMEELDQWLYDPIKSTKSLGHEKLLRKMSGNPKLWWLCPDDESWLHALPGSSLKCTNCNFYGHKTKSCPETRKVIMCRMCGGSGHTYDRCSQRMCLKCGRKNDVFTDRCSACATPYANSCKICLSQTHEWKTCPDLWRRYHLTVSPGEPIPPEAPDQRPKYEHWCSNCAKKGHLSHECLKNQWKCESISPFIMSYSSIKAEETKMEGPIKVALLLTDGDAAELSSPEGSSFLQKVSEENKVSIHTSLDIAYKKLTMEGTNLSLQEARAQIQNFIRSKSGCIRKVPLSFTQSEEEALSSEAGRTFLQLTSRRLKVEFYFDTADKRKISVEGSGPDILKVEKQIRHWLSRQTAKSGDKRGCLKVLNQTLPRNCEELVEYLKMELKLLEGRVSNCPVKRMFNNYLHPNTGLKKKLRSARSLTMILLGQCGFAEGPQKIKALKCFISELGVKMDSIDDVDDSLYDQAINHYFPIFGGEFREDFGSLVDKFYESKIFVEKYDATPAWLKSKHQPNSRCQNVTLPSSSIESVSAPQEGHTKGKMETSKNDAPKRDRKAILSRKDRKKKKRSLVQAEKCVRDVIKSLNSRFIVCPTQQSLQEKFQVYCRKKSNQSKPQESETLMKEMQALVCKLRKSYGLNF